MLEEFEKKLRFLNFYFLKEYITFVLLGFGCTCISMSKFQWYAWGVLCLENKYFPRDLIFSVG